MNSPNPPARLTHSSVGSESAELVKALSLASVLERRVVWFFGQRSDSCARSTQPLHTHEEFDEYASRFRTINHNHWSNSIRGLMAALDIYPAWCV